MNRYVPARYLHLDSAVLVAVRCWMKEMPFHNTDSVSSKTGFIKLKRI